MRFSQSWKNVDGRQSHLLGPTFIISHRIHVQPAPESNGHMRLMESNKIKWKTISSTLLLYIRVIPSIRNYSSARFELRTWRSSRMYLFYVRIICRNLLRLLDVLEKLFSGVNQGDSVLLRTIVETYITKVCDSKNYWRWYVSALILTEEKHAFELRRHPTYTDAPLVGCYRVCGQEITNTLFSTMNATPISHKHTS